MFYPKCTPTPLGSVYVTGNVNSVSYSVEWWGKGPKHWCTVCKKDLLVDLCPFMRVCQQSATFFLFSDKSPAELSFRNLHNIVLLSILSRRPMVIYVLKSSSLSFALCFHYISTKQWLFYKYKKKSTKRCTSVSGENFLWSASLKVIDGLFMSDLSQCIHPTLYE